MPWVFGINLLGVHKVVTSSQSVRQAGGRSPLEVVRETNVTRDSQQLYFDGIEVENLDVEILAGTPFMEFNDNAVRLALRAIIIRGTLYQYGSSETMPLHKAVRRAVVLWAFYFPAQLVSILKTACASMTPLSFAQLLTSLTTYSILKSKATTVLTGPFEAEVNMHSV